MAKIHDLNFGVASPVDVSRAILGARLPHRRDRHPGSASRPLHVLNEWVERRRVRRELRTMDDTLLRDAGIDPEAARAEARRPFFLPILLDRPRG